jgi:hypothetical protein
LTKILATDPGLSTGYAWIKVLDDRSIEILDIGVVKDIDGLEELKSKIEESDLLVIESFHVRPQDAHKLIFQELSAPEAIGVLKSMAKKAGIEFQMQSPSLKPVGYSWAGLTYTKGKKGMHSQDAIAHAIHCAVKRYNAYPLVSKK